jgi:hypothetical protein
MKVKNENLGCHPKNVRVTPVNLSHENKSFRNGAAAAEPVQQLAHDFSTNPKIQQSINPVA